MLAEDKPIDPAAGKTLYETYCFMCHDRGLGHAPRPGEKGGQSCYRWVKIRSTHPSLMAPIT